MWSSQLFTRFQNTYICTYKDLFEFVKDVQIANNRKQAKSNNKNKQTTTKTTDKQQQKTNKQTNPTKNKTTNKKTLNPHNKKQTNTYKQNKHVNKTIIYNSKHHYNIIKTCNTRLYNLQEKTNKPHNHT